MSASVNLYFASQTAMSTISEHFFVVKIKRRRIGRASIITWFSIIAPSALGKFHLCSKPVEIFFEASFDDGMLTYPLSHSTLHITNSVTSCYGDMSIASY